MAAIDEDVHATQAAGFTEHELKFVGGTDTEIVQGDLGTAATVTNGGNCLGKAHIGGTVAKGRFEPILDDRRGLFEW